jgi:two-component system, NtrC family, nitrogen regulation sensor histidine kinase NtrY
MASTVENSDEGLLARLLPWRSGRPQTGWVYITLVALAALAAGGLSYLILTGSAPFAKSDRELLYLLLSALAVILTLVGLIAWRLVKLWLTRKAGFAGVKLHTRLVSLFSLIAAIPAIIVAVFSGVFLFVSMDSWFSERQRAVVDHAETVAQAFLDEHREVLRTDVVTAARDIDREALASFGTDPSWLVPAVFVQANLRVLNGAYVMTRTGLIAARAEQPNTQFIMPSPDEFQEAALGRPVSFINYEFNQVYCLVKLVALPDYYLYATRPIDPSAIQHLKEAKAARAEFETAKKNRGVLQIYFFLSYLAVALVILLAAVWLGVWAANRIVQPVSRLIGAADRISEGDLGVKVDVGQSDDEIGSLARAFNRMTTQLETQRGELIEANRQLDRRRRFTEAVLSGVSAGVVGLDAQGRITLANRSAVTLLGGARERIIGTPIETGAPEFAPLVEEALDAADGASTGQIELTRGGRARTLLVRVAREILAEESRSLVITFDDISALVAAQRTSAWADVARRIAHEIKNPLTPIQLSAERLRRKYRALVAEPEIFDQCTSTIIRQVTDIGRMVDEFSSFARMPAPQMAPEDLGELVRQAVFLQRVAFPDITISINGPAAPLREICDRRLVTQALTNILKNAGEAIAARRELASNGPYQGKILVQIRTEDGATVIEVIDNGCGLPRENRAKLAEPYVTTRPKGTGLGLAIVKKIMEEHGGALDLEESPQLGEDGAALGGALVRLRFKSKITHLEPSQESPKMEIVAAGVVGHGA